MQNSEEKIQSSPLHFRFGCAKSGGFLQVAAVNFWNFYRTHYYGVTFGAQTVNSKSLVQEALALYHLNFEAITDEMVQFWNKLPAKSELTLEQANGKFVPLLDHQLHEVGPEVKHLGRRPKVVPKATSTVSPVMNAEIDKRKEYLESLREIRAEIGKREERQESLRKMHADLKVLLASVKDSGSITEIQLTDFARIVEFCFEELDTKKNETEIKELESREKNLADELERRQLYDQHEEERKKQIHKLTLEIAALQVAAPVVISSEMQEMKRPERMLGPS
jgi:DNA repair exonuclease SbcCD ATPase subunit